MYEFPYVESYKKLEGLFKAIVRSEVPDKFTYRYLAEIGFASSKDRDILPALKILGLVDPKGHPTNLYQSLRDPKAFEQALKKAVNSAYEELVREYPESASVSENVLTGYFRKLTGASDGESRIYQRTFKELTRLADFEKEITQEVAQPVYEVEGFKNENVVGKDVRNINLNISLPTTTDEKVYESLFKHLKDLLAH